VNVLVRLFPINYLHLGSLPLKLTFFTEKANNFSGNVLKLVTGASLAQAIGILLSPIVTRLFAPEAYGVSTIFLSMTAIIGVIVCLRYELAIMLPKTHEEAANVLGVALCSVFLITILSAVIVICGGDQIVSLIKAPELKQYLWLIPIVVFFQGVFSALNYWNSRTKHFGRLSVIQLISSVTTQATKLSAGFAGFVSGGVLIGTSVLGTVVSSGALAGRIWQDDKKLFKNHIRWKGIIDGFIRFRKFPIIDTWGGLLNSISWQLPALMLSSFFPISVVGFYALGLSVIMMPLSLVSGALTQVFYQKACDEKNIQGKNGELIEKLMDKMMFVGIPLMMILAMIGEELFTVIFGARWFEAGRYAQILAPWIFFWFISSPLSALFAVYERQGSALSVHSVIFLTRVISLYIGGVYQNIYLALGLFSVTGIVAYAFVATWNVKLAEANGKKILFNFSKYVLHFFPGLLCLFLVKYILHFGTIVILSSGVAIITLYFFVFNDKYYSIIKA
jgi:lipopolysaccharide exporter